MMHTSQHRAWKCVLVALLSVASVLVVTRGVEAAVRPPDRSVPADGPLQVARSNPRYFSVRHGDRERPVYLAGSNIWNNMQDAPGFGSCDQPGRPFDWTAYLDFLQAHGMTYIRGWRWEHVRFKIRPDLDSGGPYCVSPQPWARTGPGIGYDGGPRFDLTTFDQAYFDRLRARIVEARRRGMYISVMLFEGFCLHLCDDETVTAGHPFDGGNNVNGIDLESIADYQSATVAPAVLALQRAYLRKVVDTVHDLDNVLYEVANESWTGSVPWQYDVINYVKQYESIRRYERHPVGMSAIWPDGNDDWLFASPADWVMPGTYPPVHDYVKDPPPATGAKVVISDDDHYSPCDVDALWAWRSFTRGLNSSQLDCGIADPARPSPDFAYLEPARLAQGDVRRLAATVDLLAMTPRGELASTGFALAAPGREYVLLQPDAAATVTMTAAPGVYTVDWFSIDDRTWRSASNVRVGRAGPLTLTSPVPTAGPSVVHLRLAR